MVRERPALTVRARDQSALVTDAVAGGPLLLADYREGGQQQDCQRKSRPLARISAGEISRPGWNCMWSCPVSYA